MTCARCLFVCAGALLENLLKYSISLPLALLLSFRAHSAQFAARSATFCLFSVFPVPFSIPSVYFPISPAVLWNRLGGIAETFYLAAQRVWPCVKVVGQSADCPLTVQWCTNNNNKKERKKEKSALKA